MEKSMLGKKQKCTMGGHLKFPLLIELLLMMNPSFHAGFGLVTASA